ncbi:DUF2399 domain-containing protein [Streptomyces sp. NPDC006207]
MGTRSCSPRDSAVPLAGIRAASPWDPSLAEALAEHGVRVEEAVLDTLLADLAPESSGRPRAG